LEEERVLAGHVVALEDVRQRDHLALEVADPRRVADDHADEGGDVEADPAAVDDRPVAAHDPGGLELLQALEHGRRAEPDLLSATHERRATVLLYELEDMEVDVVQLDARGVTESHKVNRPPHRTLDGRPLYCQWFFKGRFRERGCSRPTDSAAGRGLRE